MVRKILNVRDPRLRVISKPVTRIDKKVKEIVRDLKDTLAIQKDPEGVGLAASQIGKNLRIFVFSFQGLKRVIINPEVLQVINTSKRKTSVQSKHKSKKQTIMEGCLSLPNYYAPLKRSAIVKLKYMDEKGETQLEEFKDFYAQIVLHEVDHLNGKLFIDRLLESKKPLFKLDKNGEWEEVELV